MISSYLIHVFIIIGIYSILAVSLNLVIGYTGLLNLGHIAFFGIGAYTSALLTLAGVPYILAILCAGCIASIFGYFVVLITRKLKGEYLALATLGLSFVVYSLFINLSGITRGPLGLSGIPKPFPLLSTPAAYLIFVIIVAALCIGIMARIVRSKFGRLLEGVRDDELGLKVLGKNTFALKYKAMMISAFFAGIAGSLFAHYINYIDPSSFYLTDVILIVTIVIVGGLASIRGSVLATIIIIAIPELLRFFALPSAILGPTRQIVYGLILIGILLYRPRGLFGRIDLT